MKKSIALVMALILVVAFVGCGKDKKKDKEVNPTPSTDVNTNVDTDKEQEQDPVVVQPAEDINAKSEGVMTYAEYVAAEVDAPVVIECYVQATQAWWNDSITVYAADGEGAYFIYGMVCTEEDAAKLVPGTKIKVTGYRAEWAGEIEVASGATFEFEEGCYIAEAKDVTDKLGTDELADSMNQLVSFKGVTVEASADGAAFQYKEGSGSHDENSDLNFTVSKDGVSYVFYVESYLCDNTTDVYAAVENLQVGDVIDVEGFLYWYNGANPHVTSVKVVGTSEEAPASDAMSYAEYVAAAVDDPIVIECYVQATQAWWNDSINVYAADQDGAYYIYNMFCSEIDAAKLVPGTKIKVTGFKAEWAGEVEVAAGSTFEFVEGDSYVAEVKDVTDKLGTDELVNYMNQFVSFKGVTVEASADGAAFQYKEGAGSHDENSDLNFTVSKDGVSYTFYVESYLCDNTTDVYAAVENLQVGDVIDVEGFLYWYNGANPHVTSVTVQ